MSGHHGHHRSSHLSRSRSHHSSSHYQFSSNRSRNSNLNSSNNNNNNDSIGGSSRSASNNNNNQQDQHSTREQASDWTEHRSSSGKVYYYNPRTGVSQWEIPAELRQQRQASPESELSESSSIRQHQDKSPSSSASSHNSAQSDPTSEDKPLLTPGLAVYFKPELIANILSSPSNELEQQANHLAKDVFALSEKILKEKVELKISKSFVQLIETRIEAQEKKCATLREIIDRFGIASYQ